MIGGVQKKILVDINDDGNLVINADFAELFYKEKEQNWKLVRERDNLTKISRAVIWIEWNKDSTFKDQFEEIGLNRSLVMSPFDDNFTWQTTPVTEILEQREDYFKFKTGNSNYELFKIKQETVSDS